MFSGGSISIIPSVILLIWVFKNRILPLESKGRAAAVSATCVVLLIMAAFIQVTFMIFSGMMSEEAFNNVMSDNAGNIDPFMTIFENVVVVGITEEMTKFLAVYICTRGMKSSRTSGEYVLYALISASTFVIIENLLYSLSQGLEGWLLRALYSGPLHCVVTLFAVFSLLKAREKKNPFIFIGGMLVSILIHGLSNSVLFITADMENGETIDFLYTLFSIVLLDVTLVSMLVGFRRDVRRSLLESSGFDDRILHPSVR